MRTLGLYLPLLLIATHLATGIYGGPSEEEVLSAINDAREVNFIKRGINRLLKRERPKEAKRSGCPAMLSKYLGTKRSYNKKRAEQTEDVVEATRLLMKRGFSLNDLNTPEVRDVWKREFECDAAPACSDPSSSIRTADGSCNNVNKPTMGMAGAPQTRGLTQVAYGDGLETPRTKSVGGDGSADLPSPRTISRRIHNEGGTRPTSPTLSLHVMIAQFLDHDIAKTPEAEEITDCCDEANNDNDNCFNIAIGSNDRIDTTGSTCMPFTRSAAVNCEPGAARIQPNAITAWIDCSNIYGSSLSDQQKLRTNEGEGAELEVTIVNDAIYGSYTRLPDNEDTPTCTLTDPAGVQKCPMAGDDRVAVVPGLTSYHTMGVREHNRIVNILRQYYDDTTEGNEALFQRARQIVIAEFQHIYYDEFLKAILSPEAYAFYRLSSDETFVYEDTTDAAMSVEFLTAAFRFHTWAPSRMIIFDERLRGLSNNAGDDRANLDKPTEETFNNPEMTYYSYDPPERNPRRPRPPVQGLDGLHYWFSGDPSPETDGLVAGAYREHLFQELDDDGQFLKALDLAALNIQRGRDHGLPGYNDYREYCGLPRAVGSLPDHTPELNTALLEVYNNVVDDIDLWTGLYTETKADGSAVGPLLNCLLGKQFEATKFGDRHWYQNTEEHSGFKPFQINEIKKTSLSKMLCNNMHYNQAMRNAFDNMVPDQLVNCDNIEDMNVDLFAPGAEPPAEVAQSAAGAPAPPEGAEPPPPPPPPGRRGGNGRPPPPPRELTNILEELEEVREIESLLKKLREDKK